MDPLSITGKLSFAVTSGSPSRMPLIDITFSERHCRSSAHYIDNLSLL